LADHLPLIASFLGFTFLKQNRRSVPYGALAAQLDDLLFQLRVRYGEESYPRTGREYLEEWASPASPYLRKYYMGASDEPEVDLMPATEKVLEWLRDLTSERTFIGTESRLLTLIKLLRELVQRTETDPEKRIRALEEERAALDAEIARAKAGMIDTLDSTQVKERYFEVEETAKKLLADFRQIESNFRSLDRDTREKIASSDDAKGKVLDEIFTSHDVIWDSDQGKSFRAFWEFLMSPSRQGELEELLTAVHKREEIAGTSAELFLPKIKIYLLEAGEKVYKTNNLLAEQLRKFLDDRAYLENRRIMELIRGIEKQAIEVKDHAPSARFIHVPGIAPELDLVLCRGLFVPPLNPPLRGTAGEAHDTGVSLSALYNQVFVDERRLLDNIRKSLQLRDQISLGELVQGFPLEHGLAEAVAYLAIAFRLPKTIVEENETEDIVYGENPKARVLRMPRVTFVR
jgi:hypothetical protein